MRCEIAKSGKQVTSGSSAWRPYDACTFFKDDDNTFARWNRSGAFTGKQKRRRGLREREVPIGNFDLLLTGNVIFHV